MSFIFKLVALNPVLFPFMDSEVQHVFSFGDPARYPLPESGLAAFMAHCHQRVGEAYPG
jgi:hypothetical protein